MNKLLNGNLKLAVQKEGRLTEETFAFLRSAGLEFESYQRRLFSSCRNFPLEIIYVRDDDIADYVSSGSVDLGIVGQNLLFEQRTKVKKLLNLRYGFCSLVVAVPKESRIENIKDLKGKKIATTYPASSKIFFDKNKVAVEIITINGSVEIAPVLGIADAIADLTSTGSTLALNDLLIIDKIFDSEGVLIADQKALTNANKKILINKLLTRFTGVLSARKYKYVMMNVPKIILPRLKKTIPGLKSPTISPLAKEGWASVQSVIKEDVFWETIERLEKIGATGIIVLPIEKMIA